MNKPTRQFSWNCRLRKRQSSGASSLPLLRTRRTTGELDPELSGESLLQLATELREEPVYSCLNVENGGRSGYHLVRGGQSQRTVGEVVVVIVEENV